MKMIKEIVSVLHHTTGGPKAAELLNMQCGESTVLELLPTMPERKWDFFNMKDAMRSTCIGAERHKMLTSFECWV